MACNKFLDLPNGKKMPAFGLGTWRGVDDSLEKGLDYALEIGYRHIDTAAAYQNEDVIGKVLKKWFDSGKLKRDDVFVTTKLAPISAYPDKVEECIKESLSKLQLDYVDLYLMHFPVTVVIGEDGGYGDPNVHYTDVWKKMEEQVDAGRAKSVGISNFNKKQVEHLLKTCRIKPANNQIELHVYLQQKDLVDYCQKNGVTVVAYSPLACRGYNEFLKDLGREPKELPDLLVNKTVIEIGNKHSKSPAQVLLRFLVELNIAPIPKSVNLNRLKENLDIFNFKLDKQDMDSLRGLDIGNDGRVGWWEIIDKIAEHPEYPFFG